MPVAALLVATVIAWISAVILIGAAIRRPHVGALVERAYLALALAVFGTVYSFLATNTELGSTLLDDDVARFVLRTAVVVLVGIVPFAWVLLWATGRLGVDDTAQGDRIEAALERNFEMSKQASDSAEAAYHEANQVNAKIAEHGAILVEQGADRAEALETAHHVQETVDATAVQVAEIHDVTVPESPK